MPSVLFFPETKPAVRHSAQSLQQDHGGDTVRPQAARDILQSGFLRTGEDDKQLQGGLLFKVQLQ